MTEGEIKWMEKVSEAILNPISLSSLLFSYHVTSRRSPPLGKDLGGHLVKWRFLFLLIAVYPSQTQSPSLEA